MQMIANMVISSPFIIRSIHHDAEFAIYFWVALKNPLIRLGENAVRSCVRYGLERATGLSATAFLCLFPQADKPHRLLSSLLYLGPRAFVRY